MSDGFQIVGTNANAPFTLKLHRGPTPECLIASRAATSVRKLGLRIVVFNVPPCSITRMT